jgi:DNA-directed RNA polymerase specialized sigma24 family protein
MTFRSVGSALHWYARAVKSDGVRSVWPTPETALVPGHPGGARDQLDLVLTLWAIWRALHQLTAPERELLALYYLEALPVIDIAARWRRHPSRVYSRLQRATGKLAMKLRDEGLLQPREPRIPQETLCRNQST